MFTSDRDLLALEPNLWRDAAWAGQRLVNATGTIAGTTLTISGYDVDLASAGIDAGAVVVVDAVAYEVIARLSATTATISRLRPSPDGPVIPPSPVTSKPASVFAFAPQRAIVHGQILRMLGIEPDGGGEIGAIDESRITNPEALALAEAFGTLHLVYASASAPGDGGPAYSLWARAQHYRDRFAHERQLAAARIDVDGDGVADATRRMNMVQFARA